MYAVIASFSICLTSFEYFLSLEAEMHREAWSTVIILIISKMNKLPDDKVSFRMQIFTHYARYRWLIVWTNQFDMIFSLLLVFYSSVYMRRLFISHFVICCITTWSHRCEPSCGESSFESEKFLTLASLLVNNTVSPIKRASSAHVAIPVVYVNRIWRTAIVTCYAGAEKHYT